MKKNTQTSYQRRLDKVVDHIYQNLDGDLQIETLADIACLSPYHWHRIYSSMRGEPVATTVKRLRLHLAASRLAHSDTDIAEIASKAGYSTIESFNRAFKQRYNMPPASYRAKGSHAQYLQAIGNDDAERFNVSVQTLEPIFCATLAHRGSYLQIDQAMGRLLTELAQSGSLPEIPRMMAQFVDDPDLVEETDLQSYACVPIEQASTTSEAVEQRTLKPGLVATLHYQGPYVDMKPAYQWLYGVWLPQSGYEPDDQPALEEYLNNPQSVPPTELLTDIHLPIKELS